MHAIQKHVVSDFKQGRDVYSSFAPEDLFPIILEEFESDPSWDDSAENTCQWPVRTLFCLTTPIIFAWSASFGFPTAFTCRTLSTFAFQQICFTPALWSPCIFRFYLFTDSDIFSLSHVSSYSLSEATAVQKPTSVIYQLRAISCTACIC